MLQQLPDGLLILGDPAEIRRLREHAAAGSQQRQEQEQGQGRLEGQQRPEPKTAQCCGALRDRGGCLDPSFMLFMLAAGLATMGLSLYKAASSKKGTPLEDRMFADPYTLIPLLWGLVNSMPPLLYFHYTAVSGSSLGLKWSCGVLRAVMTVASLAAMGLVWLSLPAEVDLPHVLAKGLGFISAQKADGVKVGCKAPSLLHRRAQCQHRAQAAMSRQLTRCARC
jgi:hypothetical protein